MITRAYRTITGPALLVITDVTPIENKLQKAELSHCWRRRKEPVLDGRLQNRKQDEPVITAVRKARQREWEYGDRGRWTYEFFPTIGGREDAKQIIPGYYVTQYLIENASFKKKLRKFSIIRSES